MISVKDTTGLPQQPRPLLAKQAGLAIGAREARPGLAACMQVAMAMAMGIYMGNYIYITTGIRTRRGRLGAGLSPEASGHFAPQKPEARWRPGLPFLPA